MPSSYDIGEHFEGFVRELIDSGRYADASEVMRDGLRLLKEREDGRTAEVERFRREYAKGKASGEAEEIDPAVFLRDLKSERARRG